MEEFVEYYYFYFKILSSIDKDLKIKILKEFHNFNEITLKYIDENGNSLDYCKWYDHDRDLVKFSLYYPDIVFELTIKSLENNFYKIYAKHGKYQFARGRVTFEEYDENKLIDI